MIVIACAASGNVFGDITLQPSLTKSGEVRAPTGDGDSGALVFDYSGTLLTHIERRMRRVNPGI